jgi:hypothetical protein
MSPPNPSPSRTSTGPGPPGLPPAGGRPWPTTCPPRVPPEPGFVGRDWVFELIVDWLEHGHERFLILEAEPGWGKSALLAQLVHVSDDPARTTGSAALDRVGRAVGAAFFCSSSGGSTMNPIAFASCIAAQFIARYPAYADAVLRRLAPGQVNVTQTVGHLSGDGELIGVLTKYLHIESPNARDVYEHAVRAPLADPSVTADELVIVVDGLDDSLKVEPSIADLVAHSTDFPERIRFLVTTRRSEPVRRLFLDAAGSTRREDLGAAGRRPLNDGDIAAYVRSRDGEAPLAPWVEHAGGIDPLAARVADASDGNFLYARLLLDHSPGEEHDELLPPDLDAQYERLLGRVIPAADLAAGGSVWTKVLRPFLGTIAVSIPAAPVDPLRRWLGDRDALMLGQQRVGELTEWLADEGGGWRLYHRSMGEYLSTAEFTSDGPPVENVYYIVPRERHQEIVDSYFATLRDSWDGDWMRCDPYGLRRLPVHLSRLVELTEGTARRRWATQLCDLALDDAFQDAQRATLGDARATIEAVGLALAAAAATGDAAAIRARARRVGESWDAEMRGLAGRALADLAAKEPRTVLDELKAMLR